MLSRQEIPGHHKWPGHHAMCVPLQDCYSQRTEYESYNNPHHHKTGRTDILLAQGTWDTQAVLGTAVAPGIHRMAGTPGTVADRDKGAAQDIQGNMNHTAVVQDSMNRMAGTGADLWRPHNSTKNRKTELQPRLKPSQ